MKKWLIVVVIVIVLAIAFYFVFLKKRQVEAQTQVNTTLSQQYKAMAGQELKAPLTVADAIKLTVSQEGTSVVPSRITRPVQEDVLIANKCGVLLKITDSNLFYSQLGQEQFKKCNVSYMYGTAIAENV